MNIYCNTNRYRHDGTVCLVTRVFDLRIIQRLIIDSLAHSIIFTLSAAEICCWWCCCCFCWRRRRWSMTSDFARQSCPLAARQGRVSVSLVDSETTWSLARCSDRGVVQWRHGQLAAGTSVWRSSARAAAAGNWWMPCETCDVFWRQGWRLVSRTLPAAAIYVAQRPIFLVTVMTLQLYNASNGNSLLSSPINSKADDILEICIVCSVYRLRSTAFPILRWVCHCVYM